MVFSLLAYLVICKLLVWLKKWHLSEEQYQFLTRQDPFWSMLVRGKNDFFHQENTIMMLTTLQLTTLSVSVYTIIRITFEN